MCSDRPAERRSDLIKTVDTLISDAFNYYWALKATSLMSSAVELGDLGRPSLPRVLPLRQHRGLTTLILEVGCIQMSRLLQTGLAGSLWMPRAVWTHNSSSPQGPSSRLSAEFTTDFTKYITHNPLQYRLKSVGFPLADRENFIKAWLKSSRPEINLGSKRH